MRSLFFILSGIAALAPSALAQTWTFCQPLNRTDCPPNPALSTNATFNFTGGQMTDKHLWNASAGKVDWNSKGADFTVRGAGDSPTIQSQFYLFFGTVSVVVRSAKGQGIVSSMVMQSDDLDEIDWEFIGGNNTHVQTNYFGKGNNTLFDRAIWHPVSGVSDGFHNYTVNWTKEKIDWIIDDKVVRTLLYGQALDGRNYPQTPMNLRIGIWAGGDPEKNGKETVKWAGGETNFRAGPYAMTVESVYAKDFGNGKEYTYTDKTGSWQSIKSVEGQSAVVKYMSEPHGIAARWRALPKVARISIVAASLGVFGILLMALIIFCIKQRRAGRREHAKLLEIEKQEAAELAEYKRKHAEETAGQYGRRF